MQKAKNFTEKYRTQLVIALASAVVSAILTAIVGFVAQVIAEETHPYVILGTALGFIVISLLIGILLNSKRILDQKFKQVNDVLVDLFGFTWEDNEYFRRRSHFTVEKHMLGKTLVGSVLPMMIDRIREEKPDFNRLNVILDSGTTITPVFPMLMHYGLPLEKSRLSFYTNNLAGIDEIHKMNNPDYCRYTDRDFNLIGGQPLNTYRATTGSVTQQFLATNWENRDPNDVILSVVTANWFLGCSGLDELSLCARGEGHLEFKRALIERSDYIIVVSPLAKIIRLGNVTALNNIAPYADGYGCYRIPSEKRDVVFLLTTFRPTNSRSPLRTHSALLESIKTDNRGKNFTFCRTTLVYDPRGSWETIRQIEVPQPYISESFRDMYGYPLG